jgi:serine/threonine protein kinase
MFSEIQHYRILQRIGGGGFADVYLAKDERLRREVAIKVLQTSFAEQGDYRRFFEQEAQIVASLEHLAVVPIYDYGEIEGQLYLVMRLMRGGTLAERLTRRQNAFTLDEVIVLLERLAPTLDAIHARGIVHRDCPRR